MVHGLHYSPIFIQLTCTIPFISTYLHAIINPMLVMMMRMEYSVGPDQLASEIWIYIVFKTGYIQV